MAKPPRDRSTTDSRTYFVSANSWQGRFLLQSDRMASLFLEVLFRYRTQGKFGVHEFVVMPNHFHLLFTLAEEVTLERAMQFIKGGFSYRAAKENGRKLEIWQRGYVDHRVRDASDYARHRQYIHMNPVRAGFVNAPDKYPYSSAHGGFQLDDVPQWLKPG